MKPVHHCKACGFVSTIGSEFTREYGVRVCLDCKADYGKDADVTRWIDQAAAQAARASVGVVVEP